MKNLIKKVLETLQLWYTVNQYRQIPEILRWQRAGFRGVAPHTLKMMTLRSYLKTFSLSEFVETGTYLGETLGYIAMNSEVRCTSIELSEDLFEAAIKRFKNKKNIKLVQGDSGQKITEILNEIKNPALFWLDGHYSAGITACAEKHTPVSVELKAILSLTS